MRRLALVCFVLMFALTATPVHRPAAAQTEDVGYIRFIQAARSSAEVLIDNTPVLSGLAYTMSSDYLPVPFGEHTITITPTGGNMEDSASLVLTIEVGKYYVVAIIGEYEVYTPTLLVIDETAEQEELGPNPDGSYILMIHNIFDGPILDVYINDEQAAKSLSYGSYFYAPIAAGLNTSYAIAADQPDQADTRLFERSFLVPYDAIEQTVWSGDMASVTAAYESANAEHYSLCLNTLGLVGFMSGYAMTPDNDLTSFTSAIQVADMSDVLKNIEAITIFAPSDAAWDALPAETRESLFRDPAAMTALLNNHIVPGYWPSYLLAGEFPLTAIGGASITSALVPGQSFVLNGSIPVVHENRTLTGVIYLIDTVLLPPTQ